MESRIDFARPLEDQVRRIARARLEAAASLLEAVPEGTDRAVHGARRHIKQCRALYRLVAHSAKSFQRSQNARLSSIARDLSRLRDAAALVDVTEYLKHELGSKSNAMLMNRLAKRLERRRQRVTETSASAAAAMRQAADDLRRAANDTVLLRLPHGPRKSAVCLAAGWEIVGRKARRAMVEAASDRHEEAFHDLRKRSQDRWMHATLMRGLWPTAMTSIHRQAKLLSDLLGHMQDLAMLDAAITADPELAPDTVEHEALRDAIRSQKAKLAEECLGLGNDLFRKSGPRDGKVIGRLIRGRLGK